MAGGAETGVDVGTGGVEDEEGAGVDEGTDVDVDDVGVDEVDGS